MLDQIRSWLYIGGYRDTLSAVELWDKGIGAVLQLAEPVVHPKIVNLYLAVDDGYPLERHYWEQGVAFIREHHQKGLLIACGAGISRSTTFCMVALKEIEGLTLPDAFRVIKAAHEETLPHYALWKSLCEFYGEDAPYLDTLFGREGMD